MQISNVSSVAWKPVRDHEKYISYAGNDSFQESAKSEGMHVVCFSNDISGSDLSVYYDNILEIAAQEEKEQMKKQLNNKTWTQTYNLI